MSQSNLDIPTFEVNILTPACETINKELEARSPFSNSTEFEQKVRQVLQELLEPYALVVDFDPHPHIFPDIVLAPYGVEVKFTRNNTWRSIANSVFESTRDPSVRHIYLIFGKMGGKPEVSWARYEDSVIHVRTSHVPRFEVEMSTQGIPRDRPSLFDLMGISYDSFANLSVEDRMNHIREYARGRLQQGEHLWWIEDRQEEEHSLSLEVRLYMNLPQEEKRRLRAEATLLCPEVVLPSRTRGKYLNATMYILTYHGVLCPQTRDLFSAGSVAGPARGGNYVQRALIDIQGEMVSAAETLDDALFREYWGVSVPPSKRIQAWLERADRLAQDWKPSDLLFLEERST